MALLHLVLAVVLAGGASEPHGPASDGDDAGCAPVANESGQVIDNSEADTGKHVPAGVSPQVNIRIVGAKVLPAEVYLDMLRLPPGAGPTADTAAEVQRQMLAYLRRTGFELATVGVEVEGTDLVVRLDEGQLDRLIYVGALSFQQVRFKLELNLPANVFNRPLLDRQVRELARSMGMVGVRWELVRTSEVDHVGPQVERLPGPIDLSLQGTQFVHARRPYEVRIRFPTDTTGTGLGIGIQSGPTNGFEFGLSNRWGDLIFDGDRFLLAASGGFGLRSRLDTGALYPQFSRAFAEVRYDTPPLLGRIRPNLWVENDWLARQRGDLALENYWATNVDAALQVELEAGTGLHFLLGAGVEWRRLFGFTAQTGQTPPASVLAFEGVNRTRPLLRLTAEWVVDPGIIRWDRRHVLEGEVRQYFGLQEVGLGWVDVRYQYVKAIGWHDLWVRTHGHCAWGDVSFHDEVSVGEFTRGVFADQFVPAALNLSLEFRFSIVRDLVKVGVFNDLALFAVPLRTTGGVTAQLADGFGPGVHLLVLDMFQVDLYVTFGFRKGAQFGTAFNLQLQKAF